MDGECLWPEYNGQPPRTLTNLHMLHESGFDSSLPHNVATILTPSSWIINQTCAESEEDLIMNSNG